MIRRHRIRKRAFFYAAFFFLSILAPAPSAAPVARAQEQGPELPEDMEGIMDADMSHQDLYLLELSGTAYKERFHGAQAIMRISGSSGFDENPYLVIIEGYPRRNARNSFFWNSEGEDMEVLANRLTLTIRRNAVRPTDTHFFYLSPVLYEHAVPEGHHRQEELKAAAMKDALQTKVYATAGELRLNILSSRVTGYVWLKGYDFIE